jgi:diguanylate cyclase
MLHGLFELPGTVWARVVCWTSLLVFGAILVSLAGTYILVGTLDGPALAAAILLPAVIGGPMSSLHVLRVNQLRHANEKLLVLASTDWLTTTLNRRAFTKRVDGHLAESGAFLVIDADHFKVINDRHGHDSGDEALRLLASIIKANVREDDLVGRMGGEEFGVFLRGANFDMARLVAERIRAAVAAASFRPDGVPCPLTVSVGGASFEGRITFSTLFRIADRRLYSAKQNGRNRAEVSVAGEDRLAAGAAETLAA